MSSRRLGTLGLSMAVLMSTVAMSSVQAQTPPKKKNILQRHPVATGVAAGVAAHHYAKTRKSGFMHKHPVVTGVAAAAAAHHLAKKKP